MQPPENPAGVYQPEENCTPSRRAELIAEIESAPGALRSAVAGLSEDQLDTRYRNWAIRQIVHHIADSHANSYVRFKWALTENVPTIKDYDEGNWAALDDSLRGDILAPLSLLDGLHLSWTQLLRRMTGDQFLRTFIHPATGTTTSLSRALSYYAWHGRHHTAQITWLREQHRWLKE